MTVGFSDHTIGSLALKGAYIYGAEVLEFHFTDSREGKIFRDHKISLTPSETEKLIKDYDPDSNSRKYAKYLPFWA